jgi:hypothetical protein
MKPGSEREGYAPWNYNNSSVTLSYCHVFLLHMATINVDSSDLTWVFIGAIAEITHNRYNTLSRLIAHKRVF